LDDAGPLVGAGLLVSGRVVDAGKLADWAERVSVVSS
jgi:hypothetical protein